MKKRLPSCNCAPCWKEGTFHILMYTHASAHTHRFAQTITVIKLILCNTQMTDDPLEECKQEPHRSAPRIAYFDGEEESTVYYLLVEGKVICTNLICEGHDLIVLFTLCI